MKVFRGQAKNLRKNIKQNNVKPLLVVFGVLVMITLTYKASNGVMGVGNTMFKEGNGKGRRRRQGFDGSEGLHEPGHDDEGGSGFEGGRKYRTGFSEGQCGEGHGLEEEFKGGRVGAYEGMSSCAKNAAPVQGFRGNRKQGFRGNRRQGFRGRGLRRREGNTPNPESTPPPSGGGDSTSVPPPPIQNEEEENVPPGGPPVGPPGAPPGGPTGGQSAGFIGSRFGRRRR